MTHPSKKRFDVLRLEQLLDRELRPEEQNQVALWEKGRALAQMKSMFGWDVILEVLQSYPLQAMDDLMRMDPASTPRDERDAQQILAFAANRIFQNFQADVASAIDASRKPPDVITEQLRHVTTAPPEL